MFLSLARRLWSGNLVPSTGECLQGANRLPRRPRLELLEDRLPPAAGVSAAFAPALAPAVVGGLPPAGTRPPGATTPLQVTVGECSSPTVINLGAVFGAVRGPSMETG